MTWRDHARIKSTDAQGQQPTMNLTLTWPIQDHQAPLPGLMDEAEAASFAVIEANEPAGWRMRSPWIRTLNHDHIPAITFTCKVTAPPDTPWQWPPTVKAAS